MPENSNKTLLFIQSELETKIKQFKKIAFLDSENINEKWYGCQPFGKDTGQNSEPHSQELSVYTVDKVVPAYGREGDISGPLLTS